jgi:hypothetical protein
VTTRRTVLTLATVQTFDVGQIGFVGAREGLDIRLGNLARTSGKKEKEEERMTTGEKDMRRSMGEEERGEEPKQHERGTEQNRPQRNHRR